MAPLAASSLLFMGMTLTDARIIGNSKTQHVADGSHVGFKATLAHVDAKVLASHVDVKSVAISNGSVKSNWTAKAKSNATAHSDKTWPFSSTPTQAPAQVVHAKVGQTGPQKMMGMIDMFRAEKCAQMKNEHGDTFGSYDACVEFMYNKCKPGSDKSMDGGKKEVTTKQGFCSEFYPDEEPEEMKQADKEKHEEMAAKQAEEAAAAKEEEEAAAAAKAKAAAEAGEGGEGGAEAGAGNATKRGGEGGGNCTNGTNGTNGSKNERYWGSDTEDAVARESSWDHTDKAGRNDGGKYPKDYLMGRLHMNESIGVPAQGYGGEIVGHNDGETQTSDWLSENDFKAGDDKHIAHTGRHDHKWGQRRAQRRANLESEEPTLRGAASMLSFGAISMSVPLLMILA